jgi:hypothetical protein
VLFAQQPRLFRPRNIFDPDYAGLFTPPQLAGLVFSFACPRQDWIAAVQVETKP